MAERLDIFIIVYLNNILIYIKYSSQGYIRAVIWVLYIQKGQRFFANLKKCLFYKNKVCFFGYSILA